MKSSTYPPLAKRCEWNPKLQRLAMALPRFGDCRGVAQILLTLKSGDTLQVCEACALRPEFRDTRCRQRLPVDRKRRARG